MKSAVSSSKSNGKTIRLIGNIGNIVSLVFAVTIAINAACYLLQSETSKTSNKRSLFTQFHDKGIDIQNDTMNATAAALASIVPTSLKSVSFPAYLDERWFAEGYCAPTGSDMISTHTESGVAMSLCIIFCLGIYFAFLSNPKNMTATAKKNLDQVNSYVLYYGLGNMGHAFAHFLIAHHIQNGLFPPGDITFLEDLLDPVSTPNYFIAIIKVVPGFLLFWVPVLKSYMTHVPWKHIILMSVPSYCVSMIIPTKLGFTYVQTFLFTGSALDNLFYVPKDQKEKLAYMLWPLVVIIPSLATSTMEATMCSTSSIMKSWGHVAFDSVLVLNCGLFYFICWLNCVYGCGNTNDDVVPMIQKKTKAKVY